MTTRRRARRGSLDISESRVHDAADILIAEGKDPTLELVREKLGGGSYTPIGVHLKSWRSARRPVLTTVDTDLPDDLGKLVKETASAMWHQSNVLASEKIKTVEDAANDRIKEAQIDRKALEKEIEDLESELDQREDNLDSVTNERDQLTQQLADLRIEHGKLVTETAGQKDQIQDHKDHITRIEQNHKTTVDDYKRQFDQLKLEHKDSVEALQKELESTKGKLETSEQTSAELSAKLLQSEAQYSESKSTAKGLETVLNNVKRELEQAKTERAKQEGVTTELKRRIESLEKQADNGRSEAQKWQERTNIIQKDKEALEGSLDALTKIKENHSKVTILLEERTASMTRIEAKLDEAVKARYDAENALSNLQAAIENTNPSK